MQYVYLAEFISDPEGGYLVRFSDVPEALTQGDDLADARTNAADALAVALRGYLAAGRRVPPASAAAAGLVPIPLDAATALKIAVIEAFRSSGITKSELARRLGKPDNEPFRILDPDHPTKLPALQAALEVLGKQIVIEVRDAA